jgi:hypothetical protein
MNRGLAVIVIFTVLIAAAYATTSRSYYSSHNPLLEDIRSNFRKLNPSYGNIPLKEGDSAYTENKEVITLCLVNPETNTNYDINTLMYVAIHELAHVVSKNEGHGDEFKANFASLLKLASEKDIYNPRKPIPATYCKVNTGKG